MENVRGDADGRELLRRYECYCYQAAYFLLGNETDALAASKAALLELADDPGFRELPEPEQLKKVKRAVSFHSIKIRKNTVLAG